MSSLSLFTRFRQPAAEPAEPSGAQPTDGDTGDASVETPAWAGSAEGAPAEDGPVENVPAEAGPAENRLTESGPAEAGPAAPRRRRVLAAMVTAMACGVVAFALIAPDRIDRLTPGAFVRVPLEGLVAVALALLLPPKARRISAALLGVAFGLLAIVKIIDMGFFAVLDRPFNLVYDWILLSDAVEFLTTSIGRAGAIACVVAAAVLAVAVLVAGALAMARLSGIAARHRTAAFRTTGVLAVAWVACALLGAQIVPGLPVAAIAVDRSLQVTGTLKDEQRFAAQIGVDAFARTPGDRLLTGLRGKDVLLAFVESYGRTAVQDPFFAPRVDAVLDAGTRRLKADGFAARSAYLTSSTAGGGSWLAHGTLLSGLWVDSQQRYEKLVKTHRLTLNGAFRRAGWRTVAVVPGTVRAWPEAGFFGYDQVYDRWHLGYNGPRFNWGTPPDQYTLSAFQKFERSQPGHTPVMAEMPLVSSHAPWAPTPRMIDWKKVGDGSAFNGMPQTGARRDDVWTNPAKIRAAYRGAIEYTLNALITYLETYGDKNLVVVFVGDHQPAPVVTGNGASRDVPISIVAKDPAVLDKISGWGWEDGLKPGSNAPVWRMSAFRDRFLTAFGPQAGQAR